MCKDILKYNFLITLLLVFLFSNICIISAADIDSMQTEIDLNGYSFIIGENEAMQYSIDEICGLMEPEDQPPDTNFDPMLGDIESLPSKFDWRMKGGVPSVRNQRSCGSCWAFAIAGVMESAIRIFADNTVDLSEQYLVSCNYDGYGCEGGWWSAHKYHLNAIPRGEKSSGAVEEKEFPYKAKDLPCNPPHPHPFKLKSWSYIGRNYYPSIEQIQKAIYKYGPAAVAVRVDSYFQAYRGGVFDRHSSGSINHAVILVGWDNNYEYEGKKYGVWILKNSWGKFWGDEGYMYIKYNTSSVGYSANYVTISDDIKYCQTPVSGDMLINWNCILKKSYIVPENVLVQNNSVLTIPSGIELDINFQNNHLRVDSGCGILIKKGGAIK